jgi:pimeloyl-ACP methyl ester carboxylesterase
MGEHVPDEMGGLWLHPIKLGTLAQVEAIQRGISGPVETLTLQGCGHAPHAERPEEVLDAIARFVAALS